MVSLELHLSGGTSNLCSVQPMVLSSFTHAYVMPPPMSPWYAPEPDMGPLLVSLAFHQSLMQAHLMALL